MLTLSSTRERTLWVCTVAVLVAIYGTLAQVSALARKLTQSGIVEEAVMLCMLLILATIFVQGLSARPGGLELGVAVGVVAVYGLLFLRMSAAPEERTHLMEYGVVAVLIHGALSERRRHGLSPTRPAFLAAAAAAVLGVVDEAIQAAIPGRVFDPVDILFNVLASTMAVVALEALAWARRLAVARKN